jgi:hypothetical protein
MPSIRMPQLRLGAVIAIGIAAGLGVWLATRDTGGSRTTAPTTPTTAQGPTGKQVVPVTSQGLGTLVAALQRPIYWAGPQAGTTYELTRLGDGRVYVRYLPKGVKVGSSRAALTVGTYPDASAAADVERSAGRPESVRVKAPGGVVAFYNKSRPTNVYLAFPGAAYQVEVYDPDGARARALVQAGKIAAVPAAGTGARILSPAALASFAHTQKTPVYWAGPRSGTAYELTTTLDNRAYVRYLPPGTKAGSKTPALTVASYPTPDAFSRTKAASTGSAAEQVPVTGGGIAFSPRGASTSVYVAYPGSDVQIEVFDPKPGEARQLVVAGKIIPIR